jgi:uroporphyrinogen decarboxylase
MTVEEKQKKSFSGLRVGAFERRMQAEMSQLISNLGGVPTVVPSMREVPVEDYQDVFAFGTLLLEGQVDVVILMTGVGTRSLIKILSTKFPQEKIVAALAATKIVARGPKPVKALGEFGLKPTLAVPEPNTWREILKTLDAKLDIQKKSVAVQEYGESNNLFLAELGARGAKVKTVRVYRAELPEDTGPLRKLARQIADGKFDVLLFTNATQVDNVMTIVREEGVSQEFRRALSNMVVASVGPSCTTVLRKYSLPVDLEPTRPMMGALVVEAADQSATLIETKKRRGPAVAGGSSPRNQPDNVLHNSLFLRACRREKTERTPIWLMRQAGRYMKEYRELRAKVSFIDLCKNSELCAEVTVDAAHRLNVDAAIIFSDLLMIVEPLGFELSYGKDQGPAIGNPFRSAADLKRLKEVDPHSSLNFTLAAIQMTRSQLRPDLPLIGFAGAPFTLASYLIEGKGSKNFAFTKKLMHEDEKTWNALLEKITTSTAAYLNAQIHAGCQAIQIFDSWVGCLNPGDYARFVAPHLSRLISSLTPGVPVISFGTQTGGFLTEMSEAGGDVIGVDWRVELDEAWTIIGPDKAIMGNLDPTVLLSSKEEIARQAQRILKQVDGRPGHIFNLGHGVLPETPLENVLHLIEFVRKESAR